MFLIRANVRRWVSAVPLIQPLASFSAGAHKRAIVKWFVLVAAASAPVVLTVLLSNVPKGNELSFWQKLLKGLSDSISVSEQFVYTAAFLAPTIYLLWQSYTDYREDKNRENENQQNNRNEGEPRRSKKLADVIKIYKGYGLILVVSLIVLVATAIGYSFLKTEAPQFKQTFLYSILSNWSSYIYCFSLYAFYLSIIQELGPEGEYHDTVSGEAKAVAQGLSARVNKGI